MKTNRILAVVVTLAMVAAAVVLGLPGRPVSRDGSLYLTDKAGVISQSDAQAFLDRQRNASPRLSVAVVKSTGKVSVEDYCVSLWDQWRLGTSDLLLLLVTGDQEYYFGYDWSASFAGTLDQSYQSLLDRYLEPDFAAGDYGRAILTFSDGVQAALAGPVPPDTGSVWTVDPSEYAHGGSGRIGMLLAAIVIVILLIAVVSAGSIGRRSRRRRGFTVMPPPPPRTRMRRPPMMPPPPPPRPGRTVRPPQPPRTPSRPASRPSSFGRGGFTGGGRSSGGFTGGGRSSGGMRGGGRSGGGMGGGGRSGGMRGGGRR